MRQTATATAPAGPARTWEAAYPGTADQVRHVRAALRPLLHDCPVPMTARVFRALYAGFDLHTVGGTHIAVPKGTPCFAGHSLGDIARQISDREHPDPAALAPGTPADPG